MRLLADRCQTCIRRIAVVIILHAAEHGIQRFIGIEGYFAAYADLCFMAAVKLTEEFSFDFAVFAVGFGSAREINAVDAHIFQYNIRTVIRITQNRAAEFVGVEIGCQQ